MATETYSGQILKLDPANRKVTLETPKGEKITLSYSDKLDGVWGQHKEGYYIKGSLTNGLIATIGPDWEGRNAAIESGKKGKGKGKWGYYTPRDQRADLIVAIMPVLKDLYLKSVDPGARVPYKDATKIVVVDSIAIADHILKGKGA